MRLCFLRCFSPIEVCKKKIYKFLCCFRELLEIWSTHSGDVTRVNVGRDFVWKFENEINVEVERREVSSSCEHACPSAAWLSGYHVHSQRFCKPPQRPRLMFVPNVTSRVHIICSWFTSAAGELWTCPSVFVATALVGFFLSSRGDISVCFCVFCGN